MTTEPRVAVCIFTKDRPLQLHGTLASFRRHCVDAATIPIKILYKASSEDYQLGYRLLKDEFRGSLQIRWIEERSFRSDFLHEMYGHTKEASRFRLYLRLILNRQPLPYDVVLFLVDDTLFVRSFSIMKVTDCLSQMPRAIGFSLRLGTNTSQCYSLRRRQSLPRFQSKGESLFFNWTTADGDFGYPLEISSSALHLKDLALPLLLMPFTNPNRLEQMLAGLRFLYRFSKPNLMCFTRSVCFCSPINKVQSVINNRSGDDERFSSQTLVREFLRGARVDVNKLDDFLPVAAHEEVPLPLRYL